jgi:hypothetical protein
MGLAVPISTARQRHTWLTATARLANGSTVAGSFSSIASGLGGNLGAARFMGFVSDSSTTPIVGVDQLDADGNAPNPDANHGLDTLRFSVPEPALACLLALSVGAELLGRRPF